MQDINSIEDRLSNEIVALNLLPQLIKSAPDVISFIFYMIIYKMVEDNLDSGNVNYVVHVFLYFSSIT
ncbi:hypothetical protein C9J12_24630 [Photobacterium frigidiphilum]|uniref:Uncharacterized protein n=1 Tax=Photobacterium frigidiphilum TaxID=264736 RepID=A0A2T3J8E7_9GAMM|nr:hypothetical protein C9J12_24630 [Photobacterium frigidiphilum]